MVRIFTIAANSFIESIRQPIYLIILWCSTALILLSPYFTAFAMLENNNIIKDMGLATILLTGLFLSTFCASNIIYQEVENRTVMTIISKPVPRASFILGKFLGLASSLFVAEYILTLVLVHTVRTEVTEAAYSKTDYPVLIGYCAAVIFSIIMGAFANFFYEKSFCSTTTLLSLPIFTLGFLALCLVDYKWELQPSFTTLEFSLFSATFLVFNATILLAAVATASSCRLPPVPTLVICALVFLLGLFSDYFFGRYTEISYAARILYTIVPNLQIYWVVDAIMDKTAVPLDYILYVMSYTILFLAGILGLAIALFQERETE